MTRTGGTPVAEHQEHVALAEIELCTELMIAAAAVQEERLSPALIDEVLDVPRRRAPRVPGQRAGRP